MAFRKYIVGKGDTLVNIAIREYGVESEVANIISANPFLSKEIPDTIPEGAIIWLPESAEAPRPTGVIDTLLGETKRVGSISRAAPGEPDEVDLRIGGKRFRFWETVTIIRGMDQQSTFKFTSPFEPDNAEFRRIFRPMSYQEVTIRVGGELLITGTLLNIKAELGVNRRVLVCEGYSKGGVLEDCTMPFESKGSMEFKSEDLRGMAREICRPFGIEFQFDSRVGATFDKVAMKSSARPLPFLSRMAAQRTLVIGSTPFGGLVFHRSTRTPPSDALIEGEAPVTSIVPEFRPQEYYSHITAVAPADWLNKKSTGGYTVENPRLRDSGIIRPLSFQVTDANGAESSEAAFARMGRMFANAIQYRATLAGTRRQNGELWRPNTQVLLSAPGAMVRTATPMVIRRVTFHRGVQAGASTVLDLILPGSFEGRVPQRLPWDDVAPAPEVESQIPRLPFPQIDEVA